MNKILKVNLFGLNTEQFGLLRSIFSAHTEINSVYIYGSRAMGTNKERSDLDLILMDKNADRFTIGKLLFEINNSDLPYTVDLQNFYALKNPALIQHIQTHGKVFYER